jgi:hypothetical protein
MGRPPTEPIGLRLARTAKLVGRAFDDALMWAELYRAWLLYYSVFLLTVMGYGLYRIRTAGRPSGSAAR